MTWYFINDKTPTIAALLHYVGTPCFAHCIDYVFLDYMNQESSEKEIVNLFTNNFSLWNIFESASSIKRTKKN